MLTVITHIALNDHLRVDHTFESGRTIGHVMDRLGYDSTREYWLATMGPIGEHDQLRIRTTSLDAQYIRLEFEELEEQQAAAGLAEAEAKAEDPPELKWRCANCGAVVPDSEVEDHPGGWVAHAGREVQRSNRYGGVDDVPTLCGPMRRV